MHIQWAAILLLCLATPLAAVAIACAGGATLREPVRAIVAPSRPPALPVRGIRSSAMLRHPYGIALRAAKETLPCLARVCLWLVDFAALFAGALRNAALPNGCVFLVPMRRCPHAAALTATKPTLLAGIRAERYAADLANDLHLLMLPRSIAGAFTKTARAFALSGGLLERCAAMVASKQSHNKASLTRGTDKRWGTLVSVTSGSKRLIRSFLALQYYTTFGIRTLWIAFYAIDRQSKRRSRSITRLTGRRCGRTRMRVIVSNRFSFHLMETA
jgi:hypothetical protein